MVVLFIHTIVGLAPLAKSQHLIFWSMGSLYARWLVALGFNATLTAEVISWRSVTHMFPVFLTAVLTQLFSQSHRLLFSHGGERRKYAGKKVRLHLELNSQPPGHESDMFTTEPARRSIYL